MKPACTLIAIFLLTVALMAAGGELYIRHRLPFFAEPPPQPPCRNDAVLGWVNKQTTGERPSFSSNRKTITVTHTADGRRVTAPDKLTEPDNRDRLLVVGDSLSYGYGLSDEETWPWLLQQKTPCLRVLNYGTPGYGTYQCLLMLERVLPELSSPKVVIYGFLEHHLVRNVAPPAWRAVLNMNRPGTVYLPYIDLDKNSRLVRYPPAPVTQWPFSQSLVMVRFAEIMYRKTFQSREYFEKMDTAWQLLMTEMRDLCTAHGCRLVVAILSLSHRGEKNFYTEFLNLNGIPYIDADIDMPPEMFLEKDLSHPNHKANAAWAEIISRHVFCDPVISGVILKN
jgi:lysophospholipase L1-like esterase